MIKKTLYGLAITCLLPISLNASKNAVIIRNKSTDKIQIAIGVEPTYGKGTSMIKKDLDKGSMWQGSEMIKSIEISKYLKPNTYGTPVSFQVKSSTVEIHVKNKDNSYTLEQFDKYQK